MSEQDAARFIANNTTDRRTSKFTPGNPNYEPFPCALCDKDIRIPGTPHGDGNHYATHTFDDEPVLNPAPFADTKAANRRAKGKSRK
jgi:hypothetical protein